MQLSCHPWESSSSYELKRISGNIGKPGLTLLVPPMDPIISTLDESAWRLVSDISVQRTPRECVLGNVDALDLYRILQTTGPIRDAARSR